MVDKEKVIESLKACVDVRRSELWSSGCCHCAYADYSIPKCYINMTNDILELLKDEPLPVLNVGKYGIYFGDCPHCGKRVTKKNTSYCPYCGRAVKWE